MSLEKVGTFVLSDESVMRSGVRIIQKGLKTVEFKNNPIMLYNHLRSTSGLFGNSEAPLPIGIWKNLRKAEGGRTLADAYIDFNDEFAAKVGNKIKAGIIRAASVGIQVLSVSDAPEDKLPGQTNFSATKSNLLEASVVDIPDNANATIIKSNIGGGKLMDLEGYAPEKNDVIINTFYKVEEMNTNFLDKILSFFKKEKQEEVEAIVNEKTLEDTVNAAVKDATSELYNKLGLLEAEVNGLKDENEKLNQEIDEYRNAADTYRVDLEATRKELDSLNDELKELQASNDNLKEEKTKLEKEIARFTAQSESAPDLEDLNNLTPNEKNFRKALDLSFYPGEGDKK